MDGCNVTQRISINLYCKRAVDLEKWLPPKEKFMRIFEAHLIASTRAHFSTPSYISFSLFDKNKLKIVKPTNRANVLVEYENKRLYSEYFTSL